MQLFCKECEAAFAGTTTCPRCGGRLLSPQEAFIFSGPAGPPPEEATPSTASGRVGIGAVLGLALTFGLREIAVGTSDNARLDPVELWLIRTVGAAFGGLIAAAGWHAPAAVGAVTGFILTALAAVADWTDTGKVGASTAAGLLLPAAGAAAGWFGGRCWPAPAILPEISLPNASSRGSSLSRLAEEGHLEKRVRPTNWIRVLVGAVICMGGAIASDQIRVALARGSEGAIQTGGAMRGPIVGLEIATFAVLLGSWISGMATGAGLRHGILVGGLAAAGILFGAANRPDHTLPAAQGFFQLLAIEEDPLTTPRGAVYVLGTFIALASFGGWLGGQMFPPLASKARRLRRLPSQS